MLFKWLFSLANLPRTQIFCIYKLIQIIIIGRNKNFLFAIFQIVVLSPNYLNSY